VRLSIAKSLGMLGSSLLAVAVLASSAQAAGSDGFIQHNAGVDANHAFASAGAHPLVSAIQTDSDHTGCPAIGQGWGGDTSSPYAQTFFAHKPTCGRFFQEWDPIGGSGSLVVHGVAYNPNSITDDVFATATYYWG
jgi:hypothetical protein